MDVSAATRPQTDAYDDGGRGNKLESECNGPNDLPSTAYDDGH